jgi:RES domain-containing protein
LRFQGVCYRAHEPQWASKPLSGKGASIYGGRFNRKGTEAFYLALSIPCMYAETSHGFAHHFPPLLTCSYDVDVDDIIDLRTDDSRNDADVVLADLACGWELDLTYGREPASWRVADRLMGDGAAGILVPSFATRAAPDMQNLVLWKWGSELPYRVEVFDPNERLPRNRKSWEP